MATTPDLHDLESFHPLDDRNELAFYGAIRKMVSYRVYDCIEFTKYARTSERTLPNLNMNHVDLFWKASQKTYPWWKEELWNLWEDFWEEEAKNIFEKLNSRWLLDMSENCWLKIGINLNTSEFFRDTNFSLSLYDEKLDKEVAIMWFFILPWKTVEIFQIQWRMRYWVWEEQFHFLMEMCKDYLRELGFKRLLVLKSSKNFLSRTPIVIPRKVQQKDMEKWIEKNRMMMWITYDANPTRKWWFKKPKSPKDREHYSWEFHL